MSKNDKTMITTWGSRIAVMWAALYYMRARAWRFDDAWGRLHGVGLVAREFRMHWWRLSCWNEAYLLTK